MREPAPDGLARLIPEPVRSDAFIPARQDLRGEATGRVQYTLHLTLLIAQCWWLTWRTRARASRPSPGELMLQFLTALQQAARLLRHQPGLALTAVLTLALGVGANTAVFSVVEAVMLRPLPYPNADRLVLLQHRDERTGLTKPNIAIGDFIDVGKRATTLAQVVAYGQGQSVVYGPDEPINVQSLSASAGLADALGIRASAGRLLTADDSRLEAAPVAVLGHSLWTNHFGADPNVIGRRIQIGQVAREIVGIAEPGFQFPPTTGRETDVIVPLRVPADAPAGRRNGWPTVFAALAPGATADQAATELRALSESFEREFPADNAGIRYTALPIRDALLGDTKRPLLLMLGAVGFVLLIACANVGNLLLARAVGRRQEMAVRMALGAGRGRLMMQLVAEGLVLAAGAAAVGTVVAVWGVPALVALVPATVSAPGLADVGLNVPVLGFTAGISLLAALAFSLVTAVSSQSPASDALVGQGRVAGSRGVRRLASGLVVAEVAFAVVLLTGAGLVTRTLGNLLERDPGFRADHILTVSVGLPPLPAYQSVEGRQAFYAAAWDALRGVPAVEEAGVAAVTPLTGNNWTVPFQRADQPGSGPRPPDVGWQQASGGYFKALRIPLIEGRYFDERDRPDTAPVVIISAGIAREYFPDGSAIGRRLRLGDADAEIVGVVGDIRRASLTDAPRQDMYFPAEQGPSMGSTWFIRTTGDPMASVTAIRGALRGLEPRLIVGTPSTLEETLRTSIAPTTLAVWLLGLFAAVSLLLAAVGVYGVMAYGVRQRTKELGTRLALGATPASLVRLVLRQGMTLAAAGIGVGLGVAWIAGRSMSSLLFEVSPFDPATVSATVIVIGTTAALACFIPAARAARIDPARTLTQP